MTQPTHLHSHAPPQHAELLVAFANSLDSDEGTDDLTSPSELTRWLLTHDLLEQPVQATRTDLDLALALRSGLHEAFAANHHPASDKPSGTALEIAAAKLPLRVGVVATRPLLRPVHDGVRGALSLLLIAAQEAVADSSWQRLKICVDAECGWTFFDASKNQSRNWCEWGCGNRAKTRNYRARQRASRTTTTTTNN